MIRRAELANRVDGIINCNGLDRIDAGPQIAVRTIWLLLLYCLHFPLRWGRIYGIAVLRGRTAKLAVLHTETAPAGGDGRQFTTLRLLGRQDEPEELRIT